MSNQNKPPHHNSPRLDDRTAIAPYNFVPITDRVVILPPQFLPNHDQFDVNRWTGWVDVELETKSPLYIRGVKTVAEFQKAELQENSDKTPHLQKIRNKPDFFHTGNPEDPVLPGSSLRGLLRSMVEIVGHGKLSPVTDNPLIYRAVGDTTSHGESYRKQLMHEDEVKRHHYTPLFKGGYIRRKGQRWFIQPAKTINGTTYGRIHHKRIPNSLKRWKNCKNANQVYVQLSSYDFQPIRKGFLHVKYSKVTHASAQPADDLVPVTLARSGKMFSKKTEAVIFEPDPTAEWIEIPSDMDDQLRDLATAYKEQVTPEQENILDNKDGVLKDYQPIFYLMKKEKLIFFGHTQMFRIPYLLSPRQMLPPLHRHEDSSDFAEAMFGKAKSDGSGSAGRVFVSEGRMLPNQTAPWLAENPVVIPKILSSPKPTTFQHYLTQSNPDNKKQLHSYNSSPRRSTLRGHKMYWHKPANLPRSAYAENERNIDRNKDKQHTQIKPIRPSVKFQFRVHFENLLIQEVGLLWWSLALPAKGEYCHKLGMAKPLGLGSIKLTPSLTTVSPQKRYSTFIDEKGQLETGVESAAEIAHWQKAAVEDFEKYICAKLGYQSFTQAPRIQALLKMLSWPGPALDKTRYMEIERRDPQAKRGKRNEYKERPVLPDPEFVK